VNIDNLRVFGSKAYYYIDAYLKNSKFDNNTFPGIFLGYDDLQDMLFLELMITKLILFVMPYSKKISLETLILITKQIIKKITYLKNLTQKKMMTKI